MLGYDSFTPCIVCNQCNAVSKLLIGAWKQQLTWYESSLVAVAGSMSADMSGGSPYPAIARMPPFDGASDQVPNEHIAVASLP